MPEPELSLLFLRPLNRSGIQYAVSGSVAAIFYGEPRLTHDVDIVVMLNESNIPKIAEMYPSPEFYVPPPEAIAMEARRDQRGHFNVIHMGTGYKADFYVRGRDELNAWALRGKRPAHLEGETVMLASPEYVIIRKLEFYREGGSEKHLRDIRAILIVSGDQLDRSEVETWVRRLGLGAEWTEAQTPD